MVNLGKYDATRESQTSTLFNYGEVPVTSAKLNRWNGNIESAFEAINRILSCTINRDQNAVLDLGLGDALQVSPQSPAMMGVKILPGLAVIPPCVVGRTTTDSFPNQGVIAPPDIAPRIDVLYLKQDGELGIATGIEGLPTVPPPVPDGVLALAQIFLRPNCVCIKETDDGVNAYLTDARPVLNVGTPHCHTVDRTPPEIPNDAISAFSTAEKYCTGTLDVFLNGILQMREVDYTENTDERGYTFVHAPPTGAIIQHRYLVDRE